MLWMLLHTGFNFWFQNGISLVFLNFSQFVFLFVSILNKLSQITDLSPSLYWRIYHGFHFKETKAVLIFRPNLTKQKLAYGVWWCYCLSTAAKARKEDRFDLFNLINSCSACTEVSVIQHGNSTCMGMRKGGQLTPYQLCQPQYSKWSIQETAAW